MGSVMVIWVQLWECGYSYGNLGRDMVMCVELW